MVNDRCAPGHAGSQTGMQLRTQDECCLVTQRHLKKQKHTLRCVPCTLQEGMEHSTQRQATSGVQERFLGDEKHCYGGLKLWRGRKDPLATAGKQGRKKAASLCLLLKTKC